MRTKTRPGYSERRTVGRGKYWFEDSLQYRSELRSEGDATITYGLGPEWSGNHRNWKPCDHTKVNSLSGQQATWTWSSHLSWDRSLEQWFTTTSYFGFSGNENIPSYKNMWKECFANIIQQLDLNCHDSVLIYSGVLQAIPLLGAVPKFLSCMNQIGRRLSKSFKRKPFSLVVRSAIQADFIDRFVVRPTIDDAVKFTNATNYVLRQMNEMYRRSSAGPLRWESKASEGSNWNLVSRDERSYCPLSSSDFQPNQPFIRANKYTRTGVTSELFLLADVAYDTAAVDPVKLWATRCGLTRPLESVWDLVPFSFVVDYVTRCGDFVSALSDEMSSQDGLRGTFTRIYGCWGTNKLFSETKWADMTRIINAHNRFVVDYDIFAPGEVTRSSVRFERKALCPWGLLSQSVNEFTHWGMSQTRYRTLLELFLQAKLR